MQKKVKIIPILLIVISTGYIMLTKVNFTKLLGSVNPMDLKSSDVPYTNNSQSTVQGALDTLYTRANTWIDPSYFTNLGLDMSGISMNSKKNMIASKSGILFKRSNGTVHYLKANNWDVEKNHIQQVFSDISCSVKSSYVDCISDLYCSVYSDGHVGCDARSGGSSCYVYADGSVYCH